MDETTGPETTVEGKLVGAVRGEQVTLERAAALAVAASGDVTIHEGGCGPVAVGGDLSITNGGCGPVLAGGNVSFERGGCQTVIAGGGARIGRSGFVGLVLAPSVTLEDGARVLCSTPQALALGAAAGIVMALWMRLVRR